jgi:hypothetical protein
MVGKHAHAGLIATTIPGRKIANPTENTGRTRHGGGFRDEPGAVCSKPDKAASAARRTGRQRSSEGKRGFQGGFFEMAQKLLLEVCADTNPAEA